MTLASYMYYIDMAQTNSQSIFINWSERKKERKIQFSTDLHGVKWKLYGSYLSFLKSVFFFIFSSLTAFLNDLWSCYILHETTLFCVSLCQFVLAHDSAFVIFHLAACLTFDCHKCFAIIESLIGWMIRLSCTKDLCCYSQEKDVFTLCNKTS